MFGDEVSIPAGARALVTLGKPSWTDCDAAIPLVSLRVPRSHTKRVRTVCPGVRWAGSWQKGAFGGKKKYERSVHSASACLWTPIWRRGARRWSKQTLCPPTLPSAHRDWPALGSKPANRSPGGAVPPTLPKLFSSSLEPRRLAAVGAHVDRDRVRKPSAVVMVVFTALHTLH